MRCTKFNNSFVDIGQRCCSEFSCVRTTAIKTAKFMHTMTDRRLSGCCFLIVAWLVMTVAADSNGTCQDDPQCSPFKESQCNDPWMKNKCMKKCKLCPEPPPRPPDAASTPSTTSTHTDEPPSDLSSSWQMSVLAAGVAVLVVILVAACIVVILFRLRKQKQKSRHARPLQRNARNASGDSWNDEAPLTIQAASGELNATVIKPGSQPTASGKGAKKPSTKPKPKRKPSAAKHVRSRTEAGDGGQAGLVSAGGGAATDLRSQVNQDGLVYTSVDFSEFKADPEKPLPSRKITEYVAVDFRKSPTSETEK